MTVTPGATGYSFDVMLAFSLDEEANRRVQSRVSTLEEELKRIANEAKGVGKEYEKSGEKVEKTSKEMVRTLRAEARAMRAEAGAIMDDYIAAQISTLNTLSGTIGSISQKALITGGAIIGGIFAEVNRYVEKAPEATRETREWAAATAALGKARETVDRELLTAALPLMQQAARVATQASRFVESHPEITSLALKAGTLLVGLGTIGLAVSRGIKLVADVKMLATIPIQLQAGRLMEAAGEKMLAAAHLQLKGVGGAAPTAAKGAGFLGTAGPIAIGTTLAAGLAVAMESTLDKIEGQFSQRFGKLGTLLTDALAAPLSRILPGFGLVRTIDGLVDRFKGLGLNLDLLGKQSKDTSDAVKDAVGGLRGSANEAQIVEAFTSWKEDDARLIREAAEDRKRIIAEAESQIRDITRNYNQQRVDINRRFSQQRAEIEERYQQETAEAAQQYQEDRARIIEEQRRREQEAAEDHQERLRQIQQDAEARLEELAADRDALGIAKEQRRVADEIAEENRSFAREQARARRETEQRLAELDAQYIAEQARRRAQFEQELAENEAQRAEELARAAEAYQQEIRQAREAQAQKLRDLQEGLNAERQRRREVFLEQIRDLDASLLGERGLRQRYYNEMLRDAEAFFAQYRAAMPSGSSFGNITGSVGTSSTTAAQNVVTSSVSGLLGGILGSIGGLATANYYDQRRIDRPISKDERALYEKSATEAMRRALGVS